MLEHVQFIISIIGALKMPNKPSQRDNYMQAPVTSFRILACMYLPLLGALGVKLHRVAQCATLVP